jgi:hypothetical protein
LWFQLAVALTIASACLFVWSRCFHGWIFDDSYIAFRYSENWANGHGLTWNAGQPPVEGFTSFAWVFVGAAIKWLFGIRPHVSMFAIAIACWLLVMGVVTPLLTRVINSPIIPSAIAVLVLALNPVMGFQAFHGLETPLHMLALAVVAYLAVRDGTYKNEWALVGASFVAYTVRPDAMVFLLSLWLIRWLRGSPEVSGGGSASDFSPSRQH